jgi:3-oxoacyl-[acyl-carrier protein] reductase
MNQRVALVTGGARGIPRAVAVDLGRSGFSVAVCYRTSAGDAGRTVAEIEKTGVRGLAVQADVADPGQCSNLVDRVRDELGPVAVLVHGAGPYHRVPVLEETPEGWREMFDANLHAAFYLSRLIAPDMIAAGWGRIVTFSVVNADRVAAQPMVTAHFIAKSGLLSLTRTLARTLAPHGITVNAISPGYIESGSADTEDMTAMIPRIPAGRLGTVDDAVRVVRWLVSDQADYVNGTNIHLSGGWGL